MSKLATKQDLNNIIEKAVKRIGEDQANIRDTEGVTITNEDIKKEREEMIEESLKEAADEAAEKLVLENTITEMVQGVMGEMGGGSGFADNQGGSNTLAKFNKRQEMGERFVIDKATTGTTVNEQRYSMDKKAAAFDERFWTKQDDANPTLLDDNQLRKIWRVFEGEMDDHFVDENALANIYGNEIMSIVQASQFSAYYRDRTGHRLEDDLDDAMATYPTKRGWKDAGSGNPKTDVKPLQAIARFFGDVDIQKVYDVIDTLPWDVQNTYPSGLNFPIAEPEAAPEINESTTNLIKKLVSKKLKNLSEVKKTTPSLDQVKKHRDESEKETKSYHKDTEKKFKEYAESDKAEENSPMHRNDEDQEEFIEDWRGAGLEDADGVEDLDRISDYLSGSQETGNAQVDEDGNDLGNVVSSELGEKIEKKIKRKREKIENQKSHMRNARGYSPAVQKIDSKPVNESVKSDMEKMKKLFNYNEKTQ